MSRHVWPATSDVHASAGRFAQLLRDGANQFDREHHRMHDIWAEHRQHLVELIGWLEDIATGQGFTIAPDGKSITCHRCGLTSHHPKDVEHRYCGRCHIFHEATP